MHIVKCIAQKLQKKIVQMFAGILFPAGGEAARSHYGQSEIRANYGGNEHHLQAGRPKPSAGEAKICSEKIAQC